MVGEIPESSLGMMKVKIICAILKKKKCVHRNREQIGGYQRWQGWTKWMKGSKGTNF